MVTTLHNICPVQKTTENTYTVLVGAEDFMNALHADLLTCKDSLFAQFMTYEGDAAGQLLSDYLIDRASNGVDVRLIVDYFSDHILSDIFPHHLMRRDQYCAEQAQTRKLFNQMRRKGIQIKRTNPFGPLWCYFFYRDHKKIIIVDEQVAYLGGINISDHNFEWHDFMVRIEGPIVQTIVEDFASTWHGDSIVLERTSRVGDYVVNQTTGRPAVYNNILDQIDRAERSILIECPYLVGYGIESALLRAAERGVVVTLILPQYVNIVVFRWWLTASLHFLNHPNIHVYGFQGDGGMTHAKLYLFDDKWASFGSLNVSELECMTHKEINVFSQNRDLIEQLKQLACDDLEKSLPLSKPASQNWYLPYHWVYSLYALWTSILLNNPAWRKQYC
ncbi:MAG: phosphatidylserine/phosphatidylglycerophosphate/cardiolipin synthase family protein [Aggregatilineales bacterium]